MQVADGGGDGPEDVEAVVVVEHQQEVQKQVAGPALEGGAEGGGLAVAADGAAGEEQLQTRVAREDLIDQGVQVVEHLLGLSAFPRRR